MRCAACAWLVDRALSREDGVREASANAITGRLRLRWDPARAPLSRLLGRLDALGYRPFLAGGEALERERRRERNSLLLRLGIAALAATQAMMFSEAAYLDTAHAMAPATRDFFRWLTLLTCTPVVFYSGMPILAGLRRELALSRGYEIAGSSLTISSDDGRQEWRFVALALSRKSGVPLSALAAELARFEGIDSFQLSHARN